MAEAGVLAAALGGAAGVLGVLAAIFEMLFIKVVLAPPVVGLPGCEAALDADGLRAGLTTGLAAVFLLLTGAGPRDCDRGGDDGATSSVILPTGSFAAAAVLRAVVERPLLVARALGSGAAAAVAAAPAAVDLPLRVATMTAGERKRYERVVILCEVKVRSI